MGFDSRLVVAGLRQTDNDGPATITLLTQNPDLLRQAIARQLPYTEAQVQQMTFLGFTQEQAISALLAFRGDVQRATEHLLGVPPVGAAAPDQAMTEVRASKLRRRHFRSRRCRRLWCW